MTRGRVPTNGNRKYQIQNIWDIHHEIMRPALVGYKNVDIASTLGVTPEMVSYTLNSELVRRQMAVMRGARDADAVDAAQRIRDMVPRVLDRYNELLENPDLQDKVLLDLGKDILDRAGYAAQRAVKVDVTQHLSIEDINKIKEVARENGYIDAEYTELSPQAIEEAVI